MACYDLTQKKIFGCKEGSLVWWHERGHQWQHENGIIAEVSIVKDYLMMGVVTALVLQDFSNAKMFWLIWVTVFACEELVAWVYAFKNKYGGE